MECWRCDPTARGAARARSHSLVLASFPSMVIAGRCWALPLPQPVRVWVVVRDRRHHPSHCCAPTGHASALWQPIQPLLLVPMHLQRCNEPRFLLQDGCARVAWRRRRKRVPLWVARVRAEYLSKRARRPAHLCPGTVAPQFMQHLQTYVSIDGHTRPRALPQLSRRQNVTEAAIS